MGRESIKYLKYSVFAFASAGLIACSEAANEPAPAADTAPAAVETAADTAPVFTPEEITALEARMSKFVADGEATGISTMLVHKGEVVSRMTDGKLRVSDDAPITDDSIYRIYSMTKPITGLGMMMLYEEGKFSLDDPVTKHIPEFENLKALAGTNEDGSPVIVDATRPATMRELLSHTAGFAYGLGGDDYANDQFREQGVLSSPDLETFIDKVAGIPLLYQPGEQWYYSAAVDVQGYIIEKLSDQSLGEYFDEKIFTPLGMTDTGFYVPEEDYDRFGQVFAFSEKAGGLVPLDRPNYAFKKETVGMESGGGGLVGTIDDYARFCQLMVNEGELDGVRLLKPETVELMRTNVLSSDMKMSTTGNIDSVDESGMGFGLDFGVIMDPEKVGIDYGKGTYFWGGAAGTWFWIDPVNDLYFIGMIQRMSAPGDFRAESAKLTYEALNN